MAESDTDWAQLKSNAESGSLMLEVTQEAGEAMKKALADHLGVVSNALANIDQISYVAGFGDCTTGHALEGRFAMKASGGTDSLANRLQQHIDQTQLMIDTVSQAMKNYWDSDRGNAASVNAVQGRVP